MINFLSSWVKSLSLALIIVSILEMILPNSKTKKYIKMVMGLYILFSIISPFINNSDSFNFENLDLNFYDKNFQETSSSIGVNQTSMDIRLNQIYKQELEKDIIAKLRDNGYEVESCKVTASISEKNSGIEKIVLKIKEKTIKKQSDEEDKDSFENRIVTEIEKIQNINIKVSKNEEKNNKEQESLKITKDDISIIKKILSEEYGVNEKCLKIS